ncbi:MAG: hypothetical protein HQK81_07185 [Desulfovibrionaceae bacterium]|nr:hypothetical protein [Desulfovibrionaceae bacterium]MBF0513835.1 hypothetical protein [Desulfovibrionaceae bacterium]
MKTKISTGVGALTAALLLGFAVQAQAATYQCVRPDKTVICSVTTDASDPDVVCNHDCKSCNLVCTAVKRIVRQGKQAVFGTQSPGLAVEPGKDPEGVARDVIEKSITE